MPGHMLATVGSLAFLATLSGPKPLPPTLRTSVSGYLSAGGLPPVRGGLLLTDSSLAFRSDDGGITIRLRRVNPGQLAPVERASRSRLELAYVNRGVRRASYVFRLDDGVFETGVPDELLRLVGSEIWLVSRETRARRYPLPEIAETPFADTLYALFGRPRARVGQVGPAGQKLMHLGQYVRGRDSVALDPGHMASEAQLRHAFAHEMAHRWATRAPAVLDSLLQGVPVIGDPKRYGYGSEWEQQAEATAFAVHFLQSTARDRPRAGEALELLGHYEFLVPGTRVLVRYLVRQPIYQRHPLRAALARVPS